MGQQLDDLADVRGLSGFVEQIEKFLQRIGIVADVADDRVQVLQDLVGILGEQALGVLIVDLQSIFELPSLHQRIGKGGDCRQVVVDCQELVGDSSSFRELTG